MKLPAGTTYYNLTKSRTWQAKACSNQAIELVDAEYMPIFQHGCNMVGYTLDGRRVAFLEGDMT